MTACVAYRLLMISGLCPPFQHTFRHTFPVPYHALLLSTHQLLVTFLPWMLCLLSTSFSALRHHVLTSFKALIITYYNCFLTSLKGKDYSQFLIPTIYHNTLFAVGT